MNVKYAQGNLKNNGFGLIQTQNILLPKGVTYVNPVEENIVKIEVKALGISETPNQITFTSSYNSLEFPFEPVVVDSWYYFQNHEKSIYPDSLVFEAFFDQTSNTYIPILNFFIEANDGVILTKYFKQ